MDRSGTGRGIRIAKRMAFEPLSGPFSIPLPKKRKIEMEKKKRNRARTESNTYHIQALHPQKKKKRENPQ